MKILITPGQVVAAAFRAPDLIAPDAVSEAAILAAQRRYIRPVLGAALYGALCRGEYPSFLEEYVRSPLALYVKLAMLPVLAVQVGAAGVVELHSANLARAGDAAKRAAARRLRSDAGELMRRAVEHMESSRTIYPEYNPEDNILNRCSIAGGVAIQKDECDGKRR